MADRFVRTWISALAALARLGRAPLAWARTIALAMTVLLALPAVGLGDARADSDAPVVTAPADAPLVLQTNAIHVPPVPAEYIEQDLGWLKIRYSPRAKELVKPLIQSAEELRARLTVTFGHPVLDHVEVRVAPTFEEMATLAPEGYPPPFYATGLAYRGGLNLVLLTLRPPDAAAANEDLNEVFRHELVHVALEDAVAGRSLPRWFHEGVAIHVSGEDRFKRMSTLWSSVLNGSLTPIMQVDRKFGGDRHDVDIAYAEAADFVRYLLRNSDSQRFIALIDRIRGGQAFEPALADAYGTDLRKLDYQWTEDLSKRYTVLPVLTGGGLLWVGVIVLLVVGYARRRRRSRETLERWEREEAAELAAIERANAAEQALVEEAGEAAQAAAGLPVVEHQGRWHTLH